MPTKNLIAGYQRFRERYESDHEVFDRLAEAGQEPKVMWIGCSDSRVVPELITGADPGELFIFRNIANVVPPFSSSACATGAAVEYAVIHLGVDHIVVCGHTECGGIAALADDIDAEHEPHIASWLELARPAREAVLVADTPAADIYVETIKTNVLQQLENLRTYPCVVAGERDASLALHGWLYDLHSGLIRAHDPTTGRWQRVAARVGSTE
jgi:carbonic anhydrase